MSKKKTSPEDKKIIKKMFDAAHKKEVRKLKKEIKRLEKKRNKLQDGSQN